MSAKVGLLEPNQHISDQPADRVKRCVAEYLVRRLLARQLTKYLFQRVQVRPVAEIDANPSLDSYSPPSQSVHGASLRWEPPKNPLTPLKAHPWANL